MILDALRQVPRTALRQVAPGGPLPDPHQLYLTFRTDHPLVLMPPNLRDSYPEEMTIVLKTQFRDLEIDDEGFSVTLFFSGVAESMYVPFASLVAFVDPGVDFGLRFEAVAAAPEEPPGEGGPPETKAEGEGAEVVSIDRFRRSSS